jgi:hypothetical protein
LKASFCQKRYAGLYITDLRREIYKPVLKLDFTAYEAKWRPSQNLDPAAGTSITYVNSCSNACYSRDYKKLHERKNSVDYVVLPALSELWNGTELTPQLNFLRIGGFCMILMDKASSTLSLLNVFNSI